jgi:FAD/FMN-containing dehydrogenase
MEISVTSLARAALGTEDAARRREIVGGNRMTETRAIEDLGLPGFRGTLLFPDSEGYDDARAVFNGMIDRFPALIARGADPEDVAAAVRLASARAMDISVYGGGHGVTGSAVCDGGIVVDLRGLKEITVDPAAKTVRAEAGATWGELDAATQEHGLAVTGGRMSTTGVAGLTLGSGSGWLERKLGFVCDNLVEAEVVTAAGEHVVASETENADLFWGLRGGGGNFGIVTAFHFRLHEIGPIIFGGMLMYPAFMGHDLLRFYRDFMEGAPDEVCGGLAFVTAPSEEFVPEPVRGQPVIGVVCAYAGPMEDAEEAFRPLREFGPPGIDLTGPIPYVALQQLLDAANPHGMQNYWTADFLSELPDEAIDVLVELATQPVSPLSDVIVVPGGGAVARVDDAQTAFGQRNAPWNVHYLSMWENPADTVLNIAHTRKLAAAMKPWTTGRVYLNYIGDEGVGRVEAAFGPEKYARLQALKAKWDPTNLFHHNQNIEPQ